MPEIYQVINGFDRYEISNTGKVRSKVKQYTTDFHLKPRKTKKGHLYVDLYIGTDGWELERKYIHQLVAEMFNLPNPDNLPIIDHIDRNKENNNIENLRYCSYSTNNINKKCYTNTGKKGISLLKNGKYQISIKMSMEKPIKRLASTLESALQIRSQIIRDNNLEWRDDYDN